MNPEQLEWMLWVVIGLTWWIMIGDTVLAINSHGKYRLWKLRVSISRLCFVVMLWPFFVDYSRGGE